MHPEATTTGRILVGTASWPDKTLIASGRFYPKEATTAEARLRYYASRFSIVEVDSSYYAMPTPATSQLWAERTPRGFVMNVKAFRLFTGHQTSPAVLPKDLQEALGPTQGNLFYRNTPPELRDELWRRFRDALAPLGHAERLGLVHFQFAPWLLRNREGHEHVRHCVERMRGFTVSVEFRNRTWFDEPHRDSTLAFERELGVVHTVVDGPQGFANSVPAVWETTHPSYALVRLHGRNAATWNTRGATAASDRFNYDYPDAELADLAASIRELSREPRQTHVVFNNNMEDQGQRNAASMMKLFEGRS
jgi:uncharacterized protein YecE (DUF72 family)